MLEPIYANKKGLFRGEFKEMAEYHGYMCISLPALSMSLEAVSLGIDSCIISPIIEDANRILKVSKNRSACLLVGLGYENKGSVRAPKERLPLEKIVVYEKYKARKL